MDSTGIGSFQSPGIEVKKKMFELPPNLAKSNQVSHPPS